MNAATAAGLGLTALGLAGYVVGLSVPYPGRAFSLTALMVGLTVVAVARSDGGTTP